MKTQMLKNLTQSGDCTTTSQQALPTTGNKNLNVPIETAQSPFSPSSFSRSVVDDSSVPLRRRLSQECVAVLSLRAARSVVCEEGCLLSGVRRG